MKKFLNILLIAIMVVVLGYSAYMSFKEEPTIPGGTGTGGGGNGGTTSQPSTKPSTPTTPTRERVVYHSDNDNTDYIEAMAFDIFNIDNCESFTDFTFLANEKVYGGFDSSIYYAKINGYDCIFKLPGLTPTNEVEYFSTDWNNYEWPESSPVYKSINVLNFNVDYPVYFKQLSSSVMYRNSFSEYSSSNATVTAFLEERNINTSNSIYVEIREEFDGVSGVVFKLKNNRTELSAVEIGDLTYLEKYYFDVLNKNNNQSYYVISLSSGTYANVNINGFNCYLEYSVTGNPIYTESMFFNYDSEQSTFEYLDLYILDPTAELENYYTIADNEATKATKYTATEEEIANLSGEELKTALTEGTSVYKFNALEEIVLYEELDSATLALRFQNNKTCTQQGMYEVCEYFEEYPGYTWGPIVRPNGEVEE